MPIRLRAVSKVQAAAWPTICRDAGDVQPDGELGPAVEGQIGGCVDGLRGRLGDRDLELAVPTL